ncbi:MAG: hypothetical protein IJ428_05805 [Clostridia bacterium]|nr:hypothetical protein [Clostridia bacterium]
MKNIEFNNGYKTYVINGGCEIRIHPTDFGLPERVRGMVEALKKAETELGYRENPHNLEAVTALDRIAREQIDAVFGDGIAAKVFGSANCASLVDGQPCFVGFIEAMSGVIKEAVEHEAEMSKTKIAKYTSQVKDVK